MIFKGPRLSFLPYVMDESALPHLPVQNIV